MSTLNWVQGVILLFVYCGSLQTAYLHFRWTKLTVAIAGCIASNDNMGQELNLISEFTAYL